MEIQWMLLALVAVCTVVIIIMTAHQRRRPSSRILLTDDMQNTQQRDDIVKQLTHQRSITAVLREGVSALSECRYKILVLDDDIDTRVLYRIEFKHDTDYAFFYPKNEKEALAWIDSIHFDLLIIDPSISRGNGERVVKTAVFKHQKLPCIITSTQLSETFRRQVLAYNIHILSKPIDFMALRSKIKQLLYEKC